MMRGRRAFLTGLVAVIAAPAVVSPRSLMSLRGVLLDPIVRLQTWQLGTEPVGLWEAFEGPLSEAPSLLRHTAFLVDPLLPDVLTTDLDGRTEPNLPLLAKGSARIGWRAGEASSAVREDVAPSSRYPRWLFPRGEALPNGFGVKQIWSNKPEHSAILERRWEERKADVMQAVVNYQQRTERMRQQLAELIVWGK